MIVVGTAGHIDHGKSAIVTRLTGTDPDRLPEEKARGMTIDLGFAFYRTPDSTDIAFVDVPGHERFVKNMIAGAGGIDVVMLVVAADDGWMPQTQEHFQIVKLLGVRHGLIVINKIDLVEPDWLDLLQQDLERKVAGSFLAGTPIFRVSAQTGQGFEDLRTHLNSLPLAVASRKDIGKARLYIDRSFIRPGIGGVVTGTLRGGSLSVGQSVTIWPAMKTGKIRTLQSHSDEVTTATPGQRTAVSFTGIDKEDLRRGGVVSDRLDVTYLRDHPVLALSVELLGEAPFSVEDRRRVLIMLGTTEVEGVIRMLDRTEIKPSGKGIVFFQPEEPLYALVGDRFILRLPTPAVTLGGGVVLDHLPRFPRRRDLESMSYLHLRASGVITDIVLSELSKLPFVTEREFLCDADYSAGDIRGEIHRLTKSGKLSRFGEFVLDNDRIKQVVEQFKQAFTTHLADKPHLKGLTIEQLCELTDYDPATTTTLTEYMVSLGEFVRVGDKYNLAGRGMSLKGVVKEAHDKIMSALRDQPYAPPTLPSLASGGKVHQEAIRYIIESGEGYKCGTEFLFLSEVWQEMIAFIRGTLQTKPSLTVADLKDRFGLTRKFAIPILEETDRLRITRREGDLRVKGDRFESQESAL